MPIDLWTQTCATELLHPNFVEMTKRYRDRDVLDIWCEQFDDVDNNLVDRFQKTFNAAFWELYLNQLFLTLGFATNRPNEHPDFIYRHNEIRVACEATVILEAVGQPRECDREGGENFEREAFYNSTALKLNSAVIRKLDEFRNYRDTENLTGIPFLVAIAPFNNPNFAIQHATAPWRFLYQIQEIEYATAPDGSSYESGYIPCNSILKENGTEIPMGIFRGGNNPDLSAIYFNPRATISKLVAHPDRAHHESEKIFATWYMEHGGFKCLELHPSAHEESLADGGYLFLNPAATHPVDPEPYFQQGVTVYTFSEILNQLVSRTPTKFLHERVTCVVYDE